MAAAAGAAAAATAEAGEAADEETQEKRVRNASQKRKKLIDFSIQFISEWRQKPREEKKFDESKISLFVESVF